MHTRKADLGAVDLMRAALLSPIAKQPTLESSTMVHACMH